jgi:predicted RecB family nuclease
MRLENQQVRLSASDLAKHLACRHLTFLDLLAARGELKRPYRHDPSIDVLIERGLRHEAAYLAYLKGQGLELLADEDGLDNDTRFQRTLDAMRAGAAVIAQADLKDGRWYGRADVLLKVDKPSDLGNWSYEVVDTKLARETRGGTILQLCLYSELLAKIQGVLPERMHVVTPGREFQPESFRLHDFLAYYRFVKARLERVIAAKQEFPTYPEPVEHCDVCQWWPVCDARRRKDDHLSFVAGISKLQTTELRNWKITTLAGLATLPLPLTRRPERGAPDTYVKAREQARLQFESRNTGKPLHELLALEAERGLARLPEPSPGDIFLDFEADPFVEEGGLEYLLGYVTLDDKQQPKYTPTWALDRRNERRMFESFIDMVVKRREQFPNLHIYHFSSYEPGALKRLMGRYVTREEEIDRLLRAGVFVDIYRVVKQALRAGIETYSLKALEVFYSFNRETALQDARHNLSHLECALELNETANIPATVFQTDWCSTGCKFNGHHSSPGIPAKTLMSGANERSRLWNASCTMCLSSRPNIPQKNMRHGFWRTCSSGIVARTRQRGGNITVFAS